MAKIAAKVANLMVNSVVIEDDVDSFGLNVTQETPVVTSLSDAGPRRVVGNYDFNADFSGAVDFAAAQTDATFFALVGDAGKVVGIDPTGAAGAGASDPHYDSTMVLASYSISGAVGGRVDFKASLQGNSALVRTVA